MTNYLNGWLRLVRLPNLFTVPGDVLAGMAVVLCHARNGHVPTTTQIAAACFASVLLYAAGLLDNDLVDQPRDAKERPDRPLPSGAVPRSHVIIVLVLFCVTALLLGYFMLTLEAVGVEVVLLAAILVYNRIKQACPLTGGLMMGLCRGLNLLFGAAVLAGGLLDPLLIWPALLAGCWAVYIFSVTLLAQRETTGDVRRWLAFLPAVAILLCIGVFCVTLLAEHLQVEPLQAKLLHAMQTGVYETGTMWLTLTASMTLGAALGLTACTGYLICRERTPVVVQKSIGLLIRNLLLLQAAACFCWDARLAVALLCCWPLHYLLCRWFYAS